MVLKLKCPADIMKRFRMSYNQHTLWKEVIVKGVDDLALHFVIEINYNIAAEHYLGSFNLLELLPVTEVDLAKIHQTL